MKLNEGEVVCPVCEGTGGEYICHKCRGVGKLDWVSIAMKSRPSIVRFCVVKLPLIVHPYPKLIAEDLGITNEKNVS